MALTIRPQTAADGDGKGYVHYQSWQETYQGLVDPGYLSRMQPERCQEIARKYPQNTLVAELDGKIVGFVAYMPSQEAASAGEISALYVLREAQGLGIGRKLLNAALEKLSCYDKVTLWVLKGNEHAFRFYRHCGFRFEGTTQEIRLGTAVTELQMVLHKLPRIGRIKQITSNRFLNFYEMEAFHRDGRVSPYYVSSRAKDISQLKAVSHENKPDGVILYGVYGEEKDKVVLIRQYRYPLGGYVYEFPAGLVEPGEDMLEAGIREMFEETGLDFSPKEGGSCSRPFFTTVGMTDESSGTVFGYCSGTPTNHHQELSEDIQVIIADREECKRILKEENVAIMCAYMLMHFIASPGDPLEFLNAECKVQNAK